MSMTIRKKLRGSSRSAPPDAECGCRAPSAWGRLAGKPAIQEGPYLRPRAVQPGFLGRQCNAETPGDLLSRLLLEIPQDVNRPVIRIELFDGVLKEIPQPLPREADLGRRRRVDRLHALILERRELDDGDERFPRFQVPADTAADLRQPRAERAVLTQLIEILVGLEQRLDEDILGVFPVSAGPNQLPIDGVLVCGNQRLEVVHGSYYPSSGTRAGRHATTGAGLTRSR